MFQFAGFAPLAGYYAFNIVGCPIRIPADHIVCADPRGFSQLIASFFASGSLGIPHTPFASLSLYLPYYLLFTLLFFVFSLKAHSTRALSQYVNEPLCPRRRASVENIGVEPMVLSQLFMITPGPFWPKILQFIL